MIGLNDDPRPWYVLKLESEVDNALREVKAETRSALEDVRREIRALKWTLAGVAAVSALAGSLLSSLPT